MRAAFCLGLIISTSLFTIAGCPSAAEQRQEFLADITQVPTDSNSSSNSQVSRQTLSDISNRLADATLTTTSTSSTGNPSANIGSGSSPQTWNANLYVFNGTGDFGASGDEPPPSSDSDTGGTGGNNSDSDDGNPPPSGGGGDASFVPVNPPPPASRGGTTWAGTVSGTDTEVVIGCCDGLFSASGAVSVFADSGGTIVGLSMPGFATLPALQVAVGAPGTSASYEGAAPDHPILQYNIVVTTRSVSTTATSFDITLDVAVSAEGGSLAEDGTAVHHVTGAFSGDTVFWTSQTSYAVNMFASATGQPDVDLDVTQVWALSGTLTRN